MINGDEFIELSTAMVLSGVINFCQSIDFVCLYRSSELLTTICQTAELFLKPTSAEIGFVN